MLVLQVVQSLQNLVKWYRNIKISYLHDQLNVLYIHSFINKISTKFYINCKIRENKLIIGMGIVD